MKVKILFEKKFNIPVVGLILKKELVITQSNVPDEIAYFTNSIMERDFELINYESLIRGPISEVLNMQFTIEPYQLKTLRKFNTRLNLRFDINTDDYKDYSPIIFENIDDLYKRISSLYSSVVRQYFIKNNVTYVEDTYKFNEDMFKNILMDLELLKFKNYSDITDRILISKIVKHFRGFF